MWVVSSEKITCQHNSVIAASIYRPTNNDTEYAAHLATAMENLAKKDTKDVIWISGDSNLPVITSEKSTRLYSKQQTIVVLTKWWTSQQEKPTS